ncbi:MAG: PIG-L family deacetylase [Bacteroidota bacterium]
MKNGFWLLLWMSIGLLGNATLSAQAPEKPNSAELYQSIKQLNVLGSVLYVAAHPDDENTRLIAYLSNHLNLHTTYLSLTRGDGGQNLIGSEIRELLGVIRTQELLAARRIDGGHQYFSRANDFGFSKNPTETRQIWNEKEVLSDVVWAIRKFQPDIIINRFDHQSAGRTHGHHTASAELSYEAFDLAGKADIFPEQLEFAPVWQPRRLFFNTSWWFYGSRENFAKADKSRMVGVDVGVYYPLIGQSNTEIAAASRSQHRCQGMGNTGSRGRHLEYLELLKGDLPGDKENLFDGINTTWTRLEGGAPIGDILAKVEADFDFDDPGASVPGLVAAYRLVRELPQSYWKEVKLAELETVIQGCLGLYLEAKADSPSATSGESVEIDVEVIQRLGQAIQWRGLEFLPSGVDTSFAQDLVRNEAQISTRSIRLATDMSHTSPYWLRREGSLGMYEVSSQLMRGLPETPRAFQVGFKFQVADTELTWYRPVIYKKTDPVLGEVYQPFEVTPPVFVGIEDKVYVFADDAGKEVGVVVKAGQDGLEGKVSLRHPEGWRVEPASQEVKLGQKGAEQQLRFRVFPPPGQNEGQLEAVVELATGRYTQDLVTIAYEHIPTQSVLRPARAKVVKIDLKKEGDRVGYIMGAGDEVPASLRQIGYEVSLLEGREINLARLQSFDAVILGIRAFNTIDRLKFQREDLMRYVEEGGTLIVQYNTNRRMVTKEVGPYPLKLSRDRVTVEEAEVRFLQPDHHLLRYPNRITEKDFTGWVQERGLYFPNEWDERYEALFSLNDPGEDPKQGALLVTKYGKGHYIYTGFSLFRELPAGVAGAYRLISNMISIGKQP